MAKRTYPVKMLDTGTVTRTYTQHIERFARFGRELKITPKANACVNLPGFKMEMFDPSVTVCIGIGKDHTAELVMSKAAWDALNSGEEIHIETTEEFKKKYVHKVKSK